MQTNRKESTTSVTVPYISLVNAGIVVDPIGDEYVQVDRHFFQFCLKYIIEQISVDAPWYLKRYPDVAGAIERGETASARVHYSRYGYFENRMPYRIEVDADWYLAQYSDVQAAIMRKDYASAQAHFDAVGFAEGRLPYPRFTLAVEAAEDPTVATSLRLVPAGG